MTHLYRFLVFALTVPALLFGSGWQAQSSPQNPGVSPDSDASDSFVDLAFEELFDITVTSVARKEQKLSEAASAVYVITREDLRRSGVNTIPEALRMVPGVQVAQIDSSTWAISARGFNSRFASKLLVMIDGRTVYTPVFSGVFWEEQDLVLEDIDRIEVIRGPGGTLWGANAVNGVINIITQSAHDTKGGLVSAGGGSLDKFIGSFRYGAALSEDVSFRVYGKSYVRDALDDLLGNESPDDFDSARGGFRLDWKASESNSFTFQGDMYSGDYGHKTSGSVASLIPLTTADVTGDTLIDAGHFLARWKHRFSSTSDLALQLYYDQNHRQSQLLAQFQVDTYDLDFQHRFQLNDSHEILWGLGQRFIVDDFDNNLTVSFNPDSQTNYVSSAFIQDEIALVPDQLSLTLGSKFSVNRFTGFEIQPSARLLWTVNETHSLWAAVSRAVRIPSRGEDAATSNAQVVPPVPPGVLVVQRGNSQFESEDLLAFEVGYRVRPNNKLFFDIAAFINVYDDLLSFETGDLVLGLPLTIPVVGDNKLEADTYGVELAATWNPADWWRVKGSFTWLRVNFSADPDSRDLTIAGLEGNDAEFQWNLQSYMDLPYDLEFDQFLYFVDTIESQGIPSYYRLDLRLGWHPTENLELSLVAQNLLEPQHQEWGDDRLKLNDRNLVERSYFGKVIWRF